MFTNKDPETGKSKGQQAKDLLKRYGSAYLITSISFAIVSFAACYALVSAGGLRFADRPQQLPCKVSALCLIIFFATQEIGTLRVPRNQCTQEI